jgi:multidrug efflux pump subunit AcrB
MDITRSAIEKNRITAAVLIIIIIGGLSAYGRMPRAEDPGFIVRTAVVLTYFPGASPERVEMLVTDKLEKAIQEMPQLDSVQSQSKTGVSVIYVNIKERYRELRPIWDDLRRKVSAAAPRLPAGVIGPVVNDEFGDVFGIVATITGEGFSYAQLKDFGDEVRDELLRIDEVAKVDVYGEQEERIFVEYSNARLAQLGVSPMQLKQILESRNIVIAGGDITTGAERIVLEPTGNIESIEDLRRTAIRLPGRTDVVYLEDLAMVTRGYIDPPQTKMRSSGRDCLGLAISMREGGNIIALGGKVRPLLDRLQASYPVGVEFDIVAFQPTQVARKVSDFTRNLLQAIGLVLLVMLAFLGLRTGLVVASLIPTTMILSLLLMSVFDIGLDQVSLASLIIALGMLVDNAIVMAESIMVQMASGKDRVTAAVDSARELRLPLLVASLTTAAAFLPFYLAESAVGEYVAPLFKVVALALLSSWVLALTMTPLLCVLFLKVRSAPSEGSYSSRFYRSYRGLLLGALRRPGFTILAMFALFVVAMMGFRYVPFMFFPPSDKEIFTAEFRMPAGTPIERTDAVVQRVEEFMSGERGRRPPLLPLLQPRNERARVRDSYHQRHRPRRHRDADPAARGVQLTALPGTGIHHPPVGARAPCCHANRGAPRRRRSAETLRHRRSGEGEASIDSRHEEHQR